MQNLMRAGLRNELLGRRGVWWRRSQGGFLVTAPSRIRPPFFADLRERKWALSRWVGVRLARSHGSAAGYVGRAAASIRCAQASRSSLRSGLTPARPNGDPPWSIDSDQFCCIPGR